MRHALYKKSEYRDVAQQFVWARAEHYRMWFTGKPGRHERTEDLLPKMVERRELVAMWFEGKLAYAAPRYCKGRHFHIEHGLGCTEGMVRLWRSDNQARIIPERAFIGLGSKPEFAFLYSTSLLCYEFCTRDNYKRHKVRAKVDQYRRTRPNIEDHFRSSAVVLFVIDVTKEEIADQTTGDESSYFVDYETFKSVPVGEQLTAPIYTWGGDGQTYPLI